MSDNMTNDKREIEWVEIGGNDDNVYTTQEGSYKNCDAIEVYEETGQMGRVPWVRVIRDGAVWVRISATLCAIGYARESQGEG